MQCTSSIGLRSRLICVRSSMQVARAMLLEEPNTVSSVESYVMQVLVQLDLDGCILVWLC
jgi:hypothetical protein